ncbi:MAG TPA: hypothetical protein VE219_03920, partial [Candidatus Sulfotelmatobacter sp.]|nr:hypothetical protein [Candidatus Sulfotelmatobacter sp.]
MTRVIRVPLAVDAQVRIRIGPFMFPLRSVLLCALASPIGWLILSLNPLPGTWRMAASAFVLMLAASMGIPMREGIWMGTWYVYQLAWTVMPSLVLGGAVQRARIKPVGTTVEAAQARPPLLVGRGRLRRFMHFATVPAAATAGRGLIVLSPGGARGIVMISGPPVSVASESYLAWCSQVIAWALALDCPLQFLTVMNHFDGDKARIAFEARTAGWPRTPLLEMESALAVDVAERTLGLRHYVVLCPGTADADGTPHLSRLGRLSRTRETSMEEAEQALQSAVRLAPSFGLDVTLPDRDDLAGLLSRTLLGSRDAMAGEGVLRMGDQHHVVLTMTQLPPTIEVGTVVEALMRTHARGVASLHILPVRPAVAQKLLHRRTSMLKYAARRGGDEIENAVALQDTSQVIAAIAQRDITPCRIALTLAVSHPLSQMAEDAGERLSGLLSGCGFRLTPVSSPCFLPALALSPGCPPLGRSLQLTSDSVALRMLPALGTPFSDVSAPLAGINVLNGAPAYFSIWSAPNHNLVVVGSSGAGKSVAAKTLLIRHLM